MKEKSKRLCKLFISTFYLSAFTFGGGYVIITLMKKKFVDELKWIDSKEMLDLVAIAQSSPGAIAVNGAIVIGYKLAISVLSFFYTVFQSNLYVRLILEGMQAGVGAVIAAVVFDMGKDYFLLKDKTSILVMAAAFGASCFLNIKVVYIILGCIAIGVLRTWYKIRREK